MDIALALEGQVGTLRLDLRVEATLGPLCIVGPNGAGKSTLLRAIAGAPLDLRGRIRLGSRTLLDSEGGIELPSEARRVGYLPQGSGLFPHLSALDNVAFGSSQEAARAALEQVDAAALAARRPQRLSGGERQRVALARALACGADCLLLDEPFAAQDVARRQRLRPLLRESPTPAIITTHQLGDLVALGGTVLVLEQGRAVQCGSLEALRAAPATDFVRELLAL